MQKIDLITQPLAELISAVGKHKETPEHLKEAIFDDLNNHADLDDFSPEYIQELLVQGDFHGRTGRDLGNEQNPKNLPVYGEVDSLIVTSADLFAFAKVYCLILRNKNLSTDLRESLHDAVTPLSAYMNLETPDLIYAGVARILRSEPKEE